MGTIGIIPPLSDYNAWADYWYYQRGVNVIPAKTREKKVFVKWSEWQVKSIPQELHEQWKQENAFADGMAIIVGKVWRGEHKGKYLIFIDCDKAKAIQEICTRNGVTVSLQDIAKKFLVEQHIDDLTKAHIFFYSQIPFVKKGHDDGNEDAPAFEVKGEGTHGIAYSTCSYHKSGHQYQIIGTSIPESLDEQTANELMEHLDDICKRYGLRYLELDATNGKGNALQPISGLFKDSYRVYKNHNRHGALLRVIESLVKRNFDIMTLEEIEVHARNWNQKHCVPPLDEKEFQRQWKDGTKWISRRIQEEEKQQQHQESAGVIIEPRQRPQPAVVVEPTEELTKEASWDDTSAAMDTTIKRDKAPKVITFCGMLLAQTNEDQFNTGYQAESSAGKSWIPIEVSNYFPSEEVEIIASASPTAFYHDGGEWDDEKKTITKDLQHKILIFLDMNNFQLLEKLRPMLSHDKKELRYMITDKNQKYGLRTKNVIIKGYPSVFFCSTRMDPDEQEKTRMILLSPSTDQEKLRESIELAAMRKGNPIEYQKFLEQDPKRKWLSERIYLIRQWGIREIIIPDYKAVFDRFMREHKFLQPRHQRDFPRIMSFIKAHALLNCFKRERPSPDTILANQTDIDAGFALYKEIEQSNELGLSPYIHAIYQDVIAPLFLANGCIEGVNGVLRDDIAKQYFKVRHKMLSPEALKNVLFQLETVGLIKQEPDPDNKRRIIVYPPVSSDIS